MGRNYASLKVLSAILSYVVLCALPTVASKVLAADEETPSTTASSGGLEEIVVQAQRRSENQQTIPVSVTSLGAAALEAADVTTALDIGKLVPSLSLNTNSGTVLVFMRGVGNDNSAIGSEASVAFYVDGVYYSRLTPSMMRLNNIDHVEVLNGPQGTLFGRNASGGLVNIITRDPQVGASPAIDSTVTYGNFQTVDASTYVSSGIGSKMAADLSVDYHDQAQGWGDNLATGQQVSFDRDILLRSKFLVEVTDSTTIKVTGEYVNGHENLGQASHYTGYRQGALDGSGPLPAVPFYDANTNNNQEHHTTEYGATFKIEQDLGFSTLIDTVAYHRDEQQQSSDIDVSPAPYEVAELASNSTDLLNELQLLSKSGSFIDWAGGLFYMDQVQKYIPAAFQGDVFDPVFGPGAYFDFFSTSKVKSIAPYGQVRFPIVGKLKATLGARYTHDVLSGNGFQGYSLGGSTIVNAIPGTAASSDNTFTKVTWKGGLDYQFTDELFGYVSASRGYKGATLNLLPFASKPVLPEVLDSYEAGVKSEWFDHRLRVNGAAFYYKITDPQVIVIATGTNPTVENAGQAKVKGFEIQTEAAPISDLALRFSATYLDAKYTDYTGAPFYTRNPNPPFYGNFPAVEASADGNYLPYAPRVTATIGGEYRWVLPNQAHIAVASNYAYQTRVFFQPDNAVPQGGYGLLDAHVSYEFPGMPLTFKLWGSNLTGKEYYNGLVEYGGPAGNIGFEAPPRIYGVTVNYKYR